MHTKVEIFNLALGALLLTKQISNVDSDTSAENRTLKNFWKTALESTLQDLDLDGTSTKKALELVTADPFPDWKYAYKYPSNCVLFRRVLNYENPAFCNPSRKDTRSTQIKRQIMILDGQKVILSNLNAAWGEIISSDLSLTLLSAPATLAAAYKLGILASPLISGKGAGPLRKEISANYVIAKAEAQELDRQENASFEEDWITSEFVEARLS